MSTRARISAVSLVVALGAAACAGEGAPSSPQGAAGDVGIAGRSSPDLSTTPVTAIEEVPASFSWARLPAADDALVVELRYARREGQTGPRALELWVAVSDDLRFASAEAGEAVVAANKRLVAQPQGSAELRIVAFSSDSLEVLDSGPLARLRFERASAGPARLELLAREPFFAPAPANDGVVLPAAVAFDAEGGR